MLSPYCLALLASFSLINASPAPRPAAIAEAGAQPTPAPEYLPTKTLQDRGIVSDLSSAASAASVYAGSLLSSLGTNLPAYVSDGVLPGLQGLPTGSAIQSSLGMNDGDVAALPTQVLNIPSYANWTQQGWNMRFRANVYKQPNIPQSQLDSLANYFLPGTSIQALPPAQQTQARNLTAEIFVIQQGNQNLTFSLAPAPTAGASGQPGGGGAVTPQGGSQLVVFPVPTTPEGDIDGFVPLNNAGLAPGNASNAQIQRLNVYNQGSSLNGNATSYLVPLKGLTIVNDIDDTLRITRIYQPTEGLLNSFARPFVPWMNMPDIYANWSRSVPDLHFHYLTTTPEQITRNYMDFILKTYPGGSFDTRPLNFSDITATLSIRKFLLEKIFQTYPQRKFILVGDTSNSDVMKDYPAMATEFPGQVQCIFLRNATATDSGDQFPYDTSGFKGLNQDTYMFFRTPDDLLNLDIQNGHCYNASVPQNLTFSYQFGAQSAASGSLSTSTWAFGWVVLIALMGMSM